MALPFSSGPRPSFSLVRCLCLAVVILWPAVALAQTATIRGAVFGLLDSGLVPLTDVTVVLTNAAGYEAAPPQTTSGGAYAFTGLPPGQYHLYTRNDLGFTNEVYNDVLCWQASCQPDRGAPIAVEAGAVFTANFSLDRGGVISGRITDAALTPLAGVMVRLELIDMDPAFYYDANIAAETDGDGVFTIRGLPAGRYWASTHNNLGYVDELFDNVPCPGGTCMYLGAVGVPIEVAPGVTTGSRDFALDLGGHISGTISDAATMAPLNDACVIITQAVGGLIFGVGSACTDTAGIYDVDGLPGGNLVAWAIPPDSTNYVPELYDNIPCQGFLCVTLMASATPIPVTLGVTTAGRDFTLGPGGTISGRVVDASTQPLEWVEVWLAVRTPAGVELVDSDWTDASGQFEIDELPPGTYYAFTESPYPDAIYNNIPCPGGQCSESLLATLGTPIAVTAGGETSSIDFALRTEVAPGAPTRPYAIVDNYAVWLAWSPGEGGSPSSYLIEAGLTPGATFVNLATPANSYLAARVGSGRYYVRVRAVNASGVSPPSEEVVVVVASNGTGATSPEAPREVVGWMSGARLTLTWRPPSDGASYVVEAGSASGLSEIASITLDQAALTYVPVPAGFYFVRVRTVNPAGTSPPSAEVMVNSGNVPAPPAAPWNLAFDVSGSTVTLRWRPPFAWRGMPTSYVVRAGSAQGLSNLAQANTGTTATTAVFNNVPPGRYYVRVHAVNALGASVASNEVVVVVP